jgi:hypothetical protein
LHRQIGRNDGPYNLFTAIYHDGFTNNLAEGACEATG